MYKIGNVTIEIKNHGDVVIADVLKKFETANTKADYQYDLYKTDCITVKENEFIIKKDTIYICKEDDKIKRYLFLAGQNNPYALCIEEKDLHSSIYIDQNYVSAFALETMFVSLLSLERRMQEYNQYILHTASIVVNKEAILFTAPSGGGKSTQASLWNTNRNSKIINGDRGLIVKEEDAYFVDGWPICGSSEICNNEKYRIKCIVVVKKGNENKIRTLSSKEAFKALLPEFTINYYDSNFVNSAFDFILDCTKHIKIYELTCTISEESIYCLENKLKEDALWMR